MLSTSPGAVANGSDVNFVDSGQSLGTDDGSYRVALGDLDNDGDLDAVVANFYGASTRIWINQTVALAPATNDPGVFLDSGLDLGTDGTLDVELGDIDGDGDLDIFLANGAFQADRVWVNQADQVGGDLTNPSAFLDTGQALGANFSESVSLGDIDNDNDLDAFVAVSDADQAAQVWINSNALGGFVAGQAIDNAPGDNSGFSFGSALGDLDGDGDLDAFVANGFGEPDRVLDNQTIAKSPLPNTAGVLLDSGLALGSGDSRDVRLGDLDGDGDLDAVVASFTSGSNVWINTTASPTSPITFTSGGTLDTSYASGLSLGDVDGDDDLDVYFAMDLEGNQVWLNDGNGSFTNSGLSLGDGSSTSVGAVAMIIDGQRQLRLGDLNGDDLLDAFVTNANEGDRVWLNSPTVSQANVADRRLFFNNSFFDSNQIAINANDDGAIAPSPAELTASGGDPADGKLALLPGQQASFVNYTGTLGGITGIMVDVEDLANPAAITAADFEFTVGNDDTPGDWQPANAPLDVQVREGAGLNGSDRITVTWAANNGDQVNDPNEAVTQQWLGVTLLANANTGLAQNDVHFWGNMRGETGNQPTGTAVNVLDALATFNAFQLVGVEVDNRFDHNRDHQVNVLDALASFNNLEIVNVLQLIDLSGFAPTAPAVAEQSPADPQPVAAEPLTLFGAADAEDDGEEEMLNILARDAARA